MSADKMHPCTRCCYHCGHVAAYDDNILPACACKRCGSADTRLIRKSTKWPKCQTCGQPAECQRGDQLGCSCCCGHDPTRDKCQLLPGAHTPTATAITHKDRCRLEITRDVIFLLQYRFIKSTHAWVTESVWLDRDEAEQFRVAHEYRWSDSRVYGVPSYGRLADLLRRDLTLPCNWRLALREPDSPRIYDTGCGGSYTTDANLDCRYCLYCGKPIGGL